MKQRWMHNKKGDDNKKIVKKEDKLEHCHKNIFNVQKKSRTGGEVI